MPDVTFSIDSLSTNGNSDVIPILHPRSCWNAVQVMPYAPSAASHCQLNISKMDVLLQMVRWSGGVLSTAQMTACSLFEERWSQTLWLTILFSIRSGLLACPLDFSAPSGTAKPSEKLWLEIHRIVCWHCLCVVCMMHGRTMITILVAA